MIKITGCIFLILTFTFLLFVAAGKASIHKIFDYEAAENTLSTFAIQKAVENCYKDEGGTVEFPSGTFVTGAIILDGLSIRDFNLKWGNNLPGFFTNAINCFGVKDLSVFGFEEITNPNSPKSTAIKLEKTSLKNQINL